MSQPVLLDEFNTRNTFHGTNRFKLHCRESDSVQPWFLFSSAVEINRISARVSNLKWNLVIKLWTCSHLNDHFRWSKRNGLDEKVFTGLLSAATRATYGVIDLIILMLDTQTSLCLLQQYGRENFCTRTHLPVVVFNYFFSFFDGSHWSPLVRWILFKRRPLLKLLIQLIIVWFVFFKLFVTDLIFERI